MTRIFITAVCVLLALLFMAVLALFAQKKAYQSKLRKQERGFLEMWNSMQSRQEEILKDARQKKDNIRTGGNSSNFNSSLDVLQNLAGGKKRGDSD
ncbi:hypothetical protein [uncultured Treponema sp.]|uniref:hypothetical protein n=1 Tax=uncultured Treponema sp. TaxID=162155 RepID=UPI0025F23594|nr:hypothetical protein [uncultured Treponema sp.]